MWLIRVEDLQSELVVILSCRPCRECNGTTCCLHCNACGRPPPFTALRWVSVFANNNGWQCSVETLVNTPNDSKTAGLCPGISQTLRSSSDLALAGQLIRNQRWPVCASVIYRVPCNTKFTPLEGTAHYHCCCSSERRQPLHVVHDCGHKMVSLNQN